MISAEAPVLFAKACEMFILELSLRAWIHTEENKRRTLQRNDIAMAITKTDTFDFLIDIVPREDIKLPGKKLQYVSSLDAMASTLSGSNRSSLQGCCSPSKIVPMTKWHTVRSSADMPCSLISVLLMNVALVENVYQHNM
ncbi:hypothetical protein DYB28_002387 [Aphanomyces astaci]|uniref:Core Histone H2A/H2B/H3 domain-containing protein n=1 Tax=Aphanomyces astaci TaxID=112090 RepID=A0A397DGS3_APHAT|nr:hypothetical protein DYB25_006641 [Aphanomyces astaci]RHY64993.1 hypothetical protein DYB38_009768 [Aphanomyces astaci]RLO01312.1 hypothetical protein DYB28_002387 [Aphanomyces astaci]